jgi:xanthine/uracil permease
VFVRTVNYTLAVCTGYYEGLPLVEVISLIPGVTINSKRLADNSIAPVPETLRLLFSSAVTTGGVVALLLNTLMPEVPAALASERAAQLDTGATG